MASTGAQLLQGLRATLTARRARETRKEDLAAKELGMVLKLHHQQAMQDRSQMISILNSDIQEYQKNITRINTELNNG